jgi:hypothetical protein
MTPTKAGNQTASPATSPIIGRKVGQRRGATVGAGEDTVRTALGKAGIHRVMISGFNNGQGGRKLLPADVVRPVEEIDDCQVNPDHFN